MKTLLKRTLNRTPFGSLARRVWCQVHGAREPWPRSTPDNALAVEILGRVLRPRSNCVDVGSSYGDALFQMIRFAPWGRHFALEPIPRVAAMLRQKYPGFGIFQVAASDAEGESEFHDVVSDSGYSGLRRRTYPRQDLRIDTIRVRTARLDDLLPPDLRIDFVKIDVEGAELQVFRGARRTLERWRPVVLFEHGLGGAEHYGTTPEMVHEFLAGCGLGIATLQGWLDGAPPLDRAAFVAEFQGGACNFVAYPEGRHDT
jgi:FkbM family methyltransferase